MSLIGVLRLRSLAIAGVAATLLTAGLLTAGPALASPAGPSLIATTTGLVASPSPAQAGQSVTLTASVAGSDGSSPAGTVQFEADGTDIGALMAVNTGGTAAPATTTVTFVSAGTEDLSAVFTPDASGYAGSAGSADLAVQQADDPVATGSPVPMTVTVGPSGTLIVTVENTSVPLTLNSAGSQATGTLGDVTVSDTRNTYPGWAVSGQEADFTGSGTAAGFSIPGNQLGWGPAAVDTLVDGATLGPAVAPVTPGLGSTPGVLAYAASGCGFGTNVLNASLTLDIPAGQVAGAYAGSMTITYLETQPSGVAGCEPETLSF